jgi:hypothetical protein
MLAVVQQQQHLCLPQPRHQAVDRIARRLLAHLEQASNSPRDERRLGKRAQITPEDPVGEIRQQPRCRLEPKPGLPDAAHTRQRHQTCLPE